MLMLAVTFLLALLVLLLIPAMPYQYDPSVPAIFKIINIRHEPNFDSYMVVMNTGTSGYLNRNLYAMTYRNGKLLPSSISTMNGYAFISTHHYGVQTFGGPGSQNGSGIQTRWLPSISKTGLFIPVMLSPSKSTIQ